MFRVRWEETALNELAKAWVEADSATRQLITQATDEIDRRLKTDPLAEGESRSEGRRVFFVLPLGVTFRVEADRPIVSILRLWILPRREKR